MGPRLDLGRLCRGRSQVSKALVIATLRPSQDARRLVLARLRALRFRHLRRQNVGSAHRMGVRRCEHG